MFNKICKNLNITKNLGKVSMKLTQKHIKSLTLEKPWGRIDHLPMHKW
jgi:hypothetical protein